jgi:hypothetical protein
MTRTLSSQCLHHDTLLWLINVASVYDLLTAEGSLMGIGDLTSGEDCCLRQRKEKLTEQPMFSVERDFGRTRVNILTLNRSRRRSHSYLFIRATVHFFITHTLGTLPGPMHYQQYAVRKIVTMRDTFVTYMTPRCDPSSFAPHVFQCYLLRVLNLLPSQLCLKAT